MKILLQYFSSSFRLRSVHSLTHSSEDTKLNNDGTFFPPFFCMARRSDHTGSIVRAGCRKRVFTPSCERAMAFTVRSIFKRARVFTTQAARTRVRVCLQVHVVITHNIYARSYSWNAGNSGLRVAEASGQPLASSEIWSGSADLCSRAATLTATVPNSARETMKILVEEKKKNHHRNHPPCTCTCMETRPPTCLQPLRLTFPTSFFFFTPRCAENWNKDH